MYQVAENNFIFNLKKNFVRAKFHDYHFDQKALVVKPFFVRPSFKQLKDWKRKEEMRLSVKTSNCTLINSNRQKKKKSFGFFICNC
jgi:hypothetical protein